MTTRTWFIQQVSPLVADFDTLSPTITALTEWADRNQSAAINCPNAAKAQKSLDNLSFNGYMRLAHAIYDEASRQA